MATPERYNPGADRAAVPLQQLEAPPAEPEPPAERAERIAYGVLVAAPENGLVKMLQDAVAGNSATDC